MPKKVRELKNYLRKVDCVCKPGKGSHTKWSHPFLSESLSLSGKDGSDAKYYQEQDVKNFLKELEKVLQALEETEDIRSTLKKLKIILKELGETE